MMRNPTRCRRRRPSQVSTVTAAAIELSAVRIWHRVRTTIRRVSARDVSPGSYVSHPSSATNLPQEIVEMIISHLAHDTDSLLAFCLTCCFWYIAALPHLHRSLITPIIRKSGKIWWPKLLPGHAQTRTFPLRQEAPGSEAAQHI